MEIFQINARVKNARKTNRPMVALESAVITHGLPRPVNKETALAMEKMVEMENGIPATICMINGSIHVGITADQLNELSSSDKTMKLSRKDLGYAAQMGISGGTTVSATMAISQKAGILVFATGGIGGVHRGNSFDISADLPTLGETPMIVVCSGAKAILDLPKTKEYLETLGVPVIGYKTEELPAFYARSSGIQVDYRADHVEAIVKIAERQWEMGLHTAILVTVPPPLETAIDSSLMEKTIELALKDAEKNKILGAKITPFLLNRVAEITAGDSMKANIALLKNNAKIAAQIARAMALSKNR